MRMFRYPVLIALLLPPLVAANGCAGASAARKMSAIGAKLTDDYKSDTQQFFQAQDTMVKGLVESIASRNRLAADLDNQNRVQRASWQAANNSNALRVFDDLSTESDNSILTGNIDLLSLHPLALPTPSTIDPKPFESVTATLNKMAQPPSLQDQITFLVNEGQDVAKQYKASLTSGAKCANSAASASKSPAPSDKQPKAGPSEPPKC